MCPHQQLTLTRSLRLAPSRSAPLPIIMCHIAPTRAQPHTRITNAALAGTPASHCAAALKPATPTRSPWAQSMRCSAMSSHTTAHARASSPPCSHLLHTSAYGVAHTTTSSRAWRVAESFSRSELLRRLASASENELRFLLGDAIRLMNLLAVESDLDASTATSAAKS